MLRCRVPLGSKLILVAGSGSRSTFKMRNRIRIQEGKNDPLKKKWRNFMFWSAECSLLRPQGFSCRLGLLYGGLGIWWLQFLIKNYEKRRKNGSGSALSQCGSETSKTTFACCSRSDLFYGLVATTPIIWKLQKCGHLLFRLTNI
jgi:hypothetical protein